MRRQGNVYRQSYHDGVPDAPLKKGEATDETGTTITFWPNAQHLRDRRVRLRDAAHPLPADGVPQQGPAHRLTDERGVRRDDGTQRHDELPLRARPGRLRRVPQLGEEDRGDPRRRSSRSSPRTPSARSRSRSPCSGRPRTPRACTPTPTRSTPTRAEPTKRDSAPRSPRWSTSTPARRASSRRRTRTSPATTCARA